jgi:hypothetical protein
MVVRFPFAPKAEKSMEPLAGIDGKQIVYRQELQGEQYVESYLTGYSSNPRTTTLRGRGYKDGRGGRANGRQPSRVSTSGPRTTICPEAYHHLVIAPGQTAHWNIRYRFYAK